MTENLLQKLEDKITLLITEMEALRDEIKYLRYKKSSLQLEKSNSSKRLQGLISMLNAADLDLPTAHAKNETKSEAEDVTA